MSVKISIIIPTFKRPQLLIKCLTALKQQNFSAENFEVIVVTDGPDDVTKTEVAYFAYRNSLTNFSYTYLPNKGGPAAARNKGAALAKGEIIAFTDDDCIPDTGWLNAWWNAYCNSQKNEIAFTGKTIVPHSARPTDYEKNIAHLETAEFITANCACSKEAFKKVGGFDEDFQIAWREDSELQFKLIAASVPIIKTEDAIIVHPVRTAPWGVSLKEQRKSLYNALLHKKHPSLYKQKIGVKPLWNYYAMVILLPLAINAYINNKPLEAALFSSGWLFFVTDFILKRLKGTSKKTDHVIEIIATSLLIPYLSVFWTLYGSLRYKKTLIMMLPENNIKKIAVFRALQLGDMLCAIPAMRSLRKAYPRAEITLLGLPWAKSFIQRFNAYFDRFIHFPGYEGLPEQLYNKQELNTFLKKMENEQFDLVLQMQGNGTIVNPLMFLFDARHVAGFCNEESFVASDLFLDYPDFGPEVLRHVALMNHLDIEFQGSYLEFPITEEDIKDFEQLYVPLFSKRFVCIHPGSRGSWRQWQPQYFAALGDHCIEQGFTVVVTGTTEEQNITRELIKCMHYPVIDLTGKTSLGAMAVLINNAFILIANCTGVSHIADALKTPSIIISMDGEPERWSPLDTTIHRMINCKQHPYFDKVYIEMVKLIEDCRELVY